MAKTPSKTPAKATAKKAASSSKPKSTSVSIDKACAAALKKLKELDLEPNLQADIEWCLGSYQADKNPAGLYEMAEKALRVFAIAKEKKTKGVTAKSTEDLEKALKSRK